MPWGAAEVGSVFYMAPEVGVKHVEKPPADQPFTFPHKFPVALPADMWAVGAIAYELFTSNRWMEPAEDTGRSVEALLSFQTVLLDQRVSPPLAKLCVLILNPRPSSQDSPISHVHANGNRITSRQAESHEDRARARASVHFSR